MTFEDFLVEHGLSAERTREPMTGHVSYSDRATQILLLAWQAGATEAIARLPRRLGEIRQGDQFHELTVIADAGNTGNGRRLWLCRCSCGTEKPIQGTRLRAGQAKSCGHLYAEKYGFYPEERD